MKNWTHSLATLATLARMNPMTRIERWALGASGLATIGMLLALASLCEESVQRGERFRAEQRIAARPGGVGLHAFVGPCRAGDVAAQSLQRLAVVGRAAHRTVQAGAIAVGTQRPLDVRLAGYCTL